MRADSVAARNWLRAQAKTQNQRGVFKLSSNYEALDEDDGERKPVTDLVEYSRPLRVWAQFQDRALLEEVDDVTL